MTDALRSPFRFEWRLVLNDGSNAVKVVPVTHDELVIGRALTTDIHLDDAQISRHHARLIQQGEQLIIEDLQTVNGTLVNGQPLTHPYPLQPDDTIGLGQFRIKVERVILPQSRQETRAYVPASRSGGRLWLLLAAGVIGLIFAGLLCWGLSRFAFWGGLGGADTSSAALNGPTLTLAQTPANNSIVFINQPVTVQAIASDPAGVTRMELWANRRKVNEIDTQSDQIVPSLNAALRWQPAIPGTYMLELRAYNTANQITVQPVANLTVVGQADTPTPSPTPMPSPTVVALLPTELPSATPTITPFPSPTALPSPTATPVPPTATPSQALLTLSVPALNVRTGPGTDYSLVGQLVQGSPVEIVGQATAGQGKWWEIVFPDAPGGVGWVSADPDFGLASNTDAVAVITVSTPISQPSQPTAVSFQPTATPLPAPTATATPAPPSGTVLRAPSGKTLLLVSNRSLKNQPALLTLSGGKSVAGGREIDALGGGDVRVVLEPDFYRALWSSPARPGGFTRGADFTAVKDKIIVMWIVPEDGRTDTEMYDELIIGGPAPAPAPGATPAPTGTATPVPILGNYIAPAGKAIFVAANRTLDNSFADLTLSGGGFGGGQSFKLDAGVEVPIELLPGSYRAVWTSPARRGGFSAGREFQVSAGEVILSWIIPDQGQVFMQFPGQDPMQINN